MCDPMVMAGVQILKGVAQYQADREGYSAQMDANRRNREAAQKGYLADVSRLKTIAAEKGADKVRADIKLKKQRQSEIATMLNSGAGGVSAILRDIGADVNDAFNENTAAYMQDMTSLQRKSLEAYGAFEQTWNSQPNPARPNFLGTMLGATASATESYIGMKGYQESRNVSGTTYVGSPTTNTSSGYFPSRRTG